MEPVIQENETLEDLQLNGFRLIQKKNGFRFGMDSVLLADFASIRPNASVVDFGTGSGILPVLLIGRNKGSRFEGIEIQSEIAEMAKRTMKLNHLEDKVTITCGNAEEADRWIPSCSIDAVICNPPYGEPGTALKSPHSSKAISRNQQQGTLKRFFKSAFTILKGKGRLILVYPAHQMFNVMSLLHEAHLEPKKFQLVYPFESKPANLVLIEAVKDARPSLHPMPPLIVFEADHVLTNKLKSVYHISE